VRPLRFHAAVPVSLALFGALHASAADDGPPPPVFLSLPNGVDIVNQIRPGSGTFAMRLTIVGGRCEDPESKQGASDLLARMLLRASGKTSATDRFSALERAGVTLDSFATGTRVELVANGLSSGFEAAMPLVVEAARGAKLEPAEITREVTLARQTLAGAADDPGDALRRAAAAAIYQDHCLGKGPGEPSQWLAGVDAGVLRGILDERLVGWRVIFTVVGDVDTDLVQRMAGMLLGDLPPGDPAFLPLDTPKPLNEERRIRVKRKTSQPVVLVALPTHGIRDEDVPAMDLLAQILGGFQERLSYEIREKRGWAYWLGVRDERLPGAGSFGVMTAVPKKRLEETERLIREGLEKIAKEPPSDEEMGRARRFLATQRARAAQSADASAALIVRNLIADAPLRSLDEEAARSEAVTPEAVRALARRLLDGSSCAVLTMY